MYATFQQIKLRPISRIIWRAWDELRKCQGQRLQGHNSKSHFQIGNYFKIQWKKLGPQKVLHGACLSLTRGGGKGGLKLFGQCPYGNNIFQKGASLTPASYTIIIQNKLHNNHSCYRIFCSKNRAFPTVNSINPEWMLIHRVRQIQRMSDKKNIPRVSLMLKSLTCRKRN